MSASAVKSALPGAPMQAPQVTTHSMMPMNMMAQKVVPTSNSGPESSSMKPLSSTSMNYVALQPPATQPLSLVQEHKPSPAPARPSEKEPEDKEQVVPNGTETAKPTVNEESEVAAKKHKPEEPSQQNNNISSETSTPAESSPDHVPEPASSSAAELPSERSSAQSKVEEKTPALSNGAKEHSEISSTSIVPRAKTPVDEVEEPPRTNSVASTPTSTLSTSNSPASTPTSKPADPPTAPSLPKTESQVETPRRSQKRKSRELKDLHGAPTGADSHTKPKRNRVRTQPYQSPLPELALIVKTLNKSPSSKAADDKLIVFYKNEFLAVRNAEGSFYVCQAMQNIYKSSRRIRIRWLSQDKNNGEIYSPDFYDFTDFDCILTNLNLNKIDKNKYQLTKMELLRTENILKRAIDVEAGLSEKPRVTEEHPDGLDLSLFRDESQLKTTKKGNKPQKRTKSSSSGKGDSSDSEDEEPESKTSKSTSSKKSVAAKSTTPSSTKGAAAVKGGGGTDRAERAATRSSRTGHPSAERATPNSTGKKRTNDKKIETKKSATKQESSNFNTLLRKSKAPITGEAVAGTISTSNAFGRPKRTARSLGAPSSSNSESLARKKPRSRA